MKRLLTAIALILLFGGTLEAQIFKQYKLGYSTTAVGISKLSPAFNNKVDTKPWNAFFLRNGIVEFQLGQGDYTYGKVGETDYFKGKGQFMALGLVIPIHKLTLIQRKDYWKGIHIAPLLGVHYTSQKMDLANKTSFVQTGINLAPSLSIQFPLGMIDLRLNNSFYFNNNDKMRQFRKPYYLFTPSISLQLDGLFELLGGRVVKSGEYHSTWRELEKIETEKTEYTYYTIETTRMTYKYKSETGPAYRKLTRAFWYISPYFSKGDPRGFHHSSKESKVGLPQGDGFGVSVGGRYRVFMADIGWEQNRGFYAIRSPKFVKELKDFKNTYPLVEGQFNASEIRGKAGVDIIESVMGILAPRQTGEMDKQEWAWTKFMRLNGGLSAGFSFPSKTEILTNNGSQLIDEFFATNPSVSSNAKTDIRKNKSAITYGLFMNFELGPISIGYDYHGNNDFGWRSSYRIGYLIPMNILFRKR